MFRVWASLINNPTLFFSSSTSSPAAPSPLRLAPRTRATVFLSTKSSAVASLERVASSPALLARTEAICTSALWPAEVITLFDQTLDPDHGFDGNVIYRDAGKHCGSYPKAFSARHGRGGKKPGGNVLYGDGHVECQDSVWKPEWDVNLEVPPRSDRNWYPYPDWGES